LGNQEGGNASGVSERIPILDPGRSGASLPDQTDQTAPAVNDQSWSAVPWRTILATVGIVLATILVIVIVRAAGKLITWVAIAGFFAVVLAPGVRRLQPRVRGRRALATGIVVFGTLFGVLGLIALFIMPVRTQLIEIITDLPGTVQDAADGRGPLGNLVEELNLDSYVQENEAELQRAASNLSDSGLSIARSVADGVIAFVTILIMTFLFISQSAALGSTALGMLPRHRRASVRRAASDAAGAVSGYMIGNLLISLAAGLASLVVLLILGVPHAIVIALWVAFADLIPLVGATIGAAVGVLAAFLESPTAGVIALAFFIVYQQFENGVLYPAVMAKRVNINPLGVLLGVLIGVELFGILGALLAVPVSGALQVAVKAARTEHRLDQLVLPERALDEAEVAAEPA
jgi:predicted PurR-regulated permease PerM